MHAFPWTPMKRCEAWWRPRGVMSKLTLLIPVLVVGLAALPSAQAQAPLPEVDRFGPQVGETVPDFSLVDQHGRPRDLQSLMGPSGAMLVFNRSADW